jgi:hypothetical protein
LKYTAAPTKGHLWSHRVIGKHAVRKELLCGGRQKDTWALKAHIKVHSFRRAARVTYNQNNDAIAFQHRPFEVVIRICTNSTITAFESHRTLQWIKYCVGPLLPEKNASGLGRHLCTFIAQLNHLELVQTCHPVTLSPFYPFALSSSQSFTLSPCHSVGLSPVHPVTLSPLHRVTWFRASTTSSMSTRHRITRRRKALCSCLMR